jgi:hypothetical protein
MSREIGFKFGNKFLKGMHAVKVIEIAGIGKPQWKE